MTSNLDTLIERATAGLDSISLAYSESLPNPASIAQQFSEADAVELISRIDSIFEERAAAELSEEVNCDVLDDYFRSMQRYASLLPFLTSRFPLPIIAGLGSKCRSTRLFVADALAKSPIALAIRPLEAAQAAETFAHIRSTMGNAIERCRSLAESG